jgi:hypothetical protein
MTLISLYGIISQKTEPLKEFYCFMNSSYMTGVTVVILLNNMLGVITWLGIEFS